MGLIYDIAKHVIKKHEIKEAEKAKEYENTRVILQAFKEKMTGYVKQFVDEQRKVFESTVLPQFEIGEKAITNYFGAGDSWESCALSLQKHTPYADRPVEVKIKERVVDSAQLSEIFFNMIENEHFNGVDTYEQFVAKAKNKIEQLIRDKIQTIWWAYAIKVVGDDEVYWRYTWRENKLLKIGTPEAEETIKVNKKRLEKQELYTTYKTACDKYDVRLKELLKQLETVGKE